MNVPQDMIDNLLLTNSAEQTRRMLREAGYSIAIHHLHNRISALIAAGKRKQVSQKGRKRPEGFTIDVPAGAALEGSEKLLRAQIRAGQVFPATMAEWEARHGQVSLAA
jgi:hypothetical protein